MRRTRRSCGNSYAARKILKAYLDATAPCREKALRNQRSLAALAGGRPKSRIVDEYEASGADWTSSSVKRVTFYCQKGRVRVEYAGPPGSEVDAVREYDALGASELKQVCCAQ